MAVVKCFFLSLSGDWHCRERALAWISSSPCINERGAGRGARVLMPFHMRGARKDLVSRAHAAHLVKISTGLRSPGQSARVRQCATGTQNKTRNDCRLSLTFAYTRAGLLEMVTWPGHGWTAQMEGRRAARADKYLITSICTSRSEIAKKRVNLRSKLKKINYKNTNNVHGLAWVLVLTKTWTWTLNTTLI